jgi:ABC-type transporter Mla subunit MlaD
LTVEDLWDLPLQTTQPNKTSLDKIARFLDHALKASEEARSFVDDTRPPEDSVTRTMFDIVLHIIKAKKAENEAARKAIETKAKKQQILALIDQKKNEKLASASIEELTAMVEGL